MRRGGVCCPWGVDRCVGTRPRPCVTPIEPGCEGGWLGRVWGPGAQSPTAGCAGGKLCTTAPNPGILPTRFSQHPFYILNEGGSRDARSLNVIFGGAARARVCSCMHACRPTRTSPTPPGRLVVIGVVLGTRPANFPAWGAREGGVIPTLHCFGCPHLCDTLREIQRYSHRDFWCAGFGGILTTPLPSFSVSGVI
jgi:hypothetical protein